MATLVNERASAVAPGGAAQVRQGLLALQERLRQVGTASAPGPSARSPFAGASWGQRAQGSKTRPAGPGDRHGRVYRRPAPPAPGDLVIPPRSAPGRGPATHAIQETGENHVVQIRFPIPVTREAVRWELHGDILEVEYLGPEFAYHHAFIVPADAEPAVEWADGCLTFRFPRLA